MKAWAQKQKGFTIVELLVVIVVIGILAGITTVTFSGVIDRAQNTKTVSAVNSYVKVMSIIGVDDGFAAVTNGQPLNACLGEVATCGVIADPMGDTPCMMYNGPVTASAAFNEAIKKVSSTLPSPSTQVLQCGNSKVRGAFFLTSFYVTGIAYYLKGDVECSSAGWKVANRVLHGDTTMCFIMP